MTDATREREQEASLTNKKYRVVYAKLGKKTFDEFSTIEEVIQDYEIKLSIDKEQYFDDRFVIGIEDEFGTNVYPKNDSSKSQGDI